MKYTLQINQLAIVNSGLKLTLDDAAIIDMVNSFVHSDAVKKMDHAGRTYYWISYELVRQELPLLSLKKDSVYRKFKNLIDQGILDAHPENQGLGRTFFAINDKFVSLFHSDPSEKNPNLFGQNSARGTDKKPDYNNTIDNTTKSNIVDIPQLVIDAYNEVKIRELPNTRPVKLTYLRRRTIQARVAEGNKVPQFVAVIVHKFAQWKGTDMEKYLVPETLFRPSHFQKYLEEARDNWNKNTPTKKADPTKQAYS